MTVIIAITNQKGGVGKTATAINVAATVAAIDQRVLLIDADPQANATSGMGIKINRRGTYYALSHGEITANNLVRTALPNLMMLPANEDLLAFDMEIMQEERREYRLKELLSPVLAEFDFVFIDCPPALNMLTINSLVAAQFALVPMQCEFFALQGLAYLLKNIERIKRNFNPTLELMGVVLTMYDRRNSLNQFIEDDVRENLKEKVFHTTIPRSVRVSESTSHGKPLIFYDFKSPAAQAYLRLAREITNYKKGE